MPFRFDYLKFCEVFLQMKDLEKFPLLQKMASENDYDGMEMLVMFDMADGSPVAVAIYEPDDATGFPEYRIKCLEVRSDRHLQGLGTAMLDELKNSIYRIRLGYLHEVKVFYEKNHFIESGEGEMLWTEAYGC